MSEPLLHHILDTRNLGAVRVAICGEPMPRNDIRIGQTVEVCPRCRQIRAARRK